MGEGGSVAEGGERRKESCVAEPERERLQQKTEIISAANKHFHSFFFPALLSAIAPPVLLLLLQLLAGGEGTLRLLSFTLHRPGQSKQIRQLFAFNSLLYAQKEALN